MGRYHWDKKTTVEECKSVSTTFLKQHDYFCGVRWGGMKWTRGGEETGSISFMVSVQDWTGEIRFQYTQTQRHSGEKESLDYPVRLTATSCRYGGKRWWFICPLIKNGYPCNRRVLKLYLGSGKYFGCRHCYNLTYESCQEHDARVDRLCKDPLLLHQMLEGRDWSDKFLAIKVAFKLREL